MLKALRGANLPGRTKTLMIPVSQQVAGIKRRIKLGESHVFFL